MFKVESLMFKVVVLPSVFNDWINSLNERTLNLKLETFDLLYYHIKPLRLFFDDFLHFSF